MQEKTPSSQTASHDSSTVVATGLEARRFAVLALADVLERSLALDDTLQRILNGADARLLDERDRGLARAIATTGVRRLGTIGKALTSRLETGLPTRSGQLEAILVAGVAQILFLDIPDHAAVDLSVRLVQADAEGRRYVALANAVLRRIVRERDVILAESDPLTSDTPDWLAKRWIKTYGHEKAWKIASAHRQEPSVDLSVKDNPENWAEKLDGLLLPTGSIRLRHRRAITELTGFEDGDWWVQDAAAALPAKLLNPQPGEKIADLCAAPGGKTAQLASTGATIIAVDRSAKRLERLATNMNRLKLSVETRAIDALTMPDEQFDAILLDAPCTATGTIRRHPDVGWTKDGTDLEKLSALQSRLLDKAVSLLRPGGRLVYCTCSLEPEEGEEQIAALLTRHPLLVRAPFTADDLPALAEELQEALTPEGDLRTLPYMLPHEEPRLAGIDGFFASRIIKP